MNRPLIVRHYRKRYGLLQLRYTPCYSLDKFGLALRAFCINARTAVARLEVEREPIVAAIMPDDSLGNSSGIIVDAVPDCREN